MQRALTAGRLTGKKGPPMGIGMLYKLKRRAEEMARQGQKPPAIAPRPDFESTAEEHLQKLRETAKELQRMLSETTGNVLEVHITRDGVRVVRMRATEEQL
jgi:uroporphyrinogen-III synthase